MTQWSSSNKLIDTFLPKRERYKSAHRKNKNKTHSDKAATINYAHHQDVPVMVRGSVYGLPHENTKRKKSHRRMNVALNVPGAEIRLPALPQINFGWRLVSFALTFLCIGFLYLAWTVPLLKVSSPETTGLQRLTEQDVNTILQLAGNQIFLIKPEEIEKKLLESFPEFSAVDVQIELPNIVRIQVEERTPILVWRQENKSILVDANGYAFPLRESAAGEPQLTVQANGPPPAFIEEQPTIEDQSTLEPVRFLPVETVSALVSLSAVVPTDATLVFDSTHGLGWKDKKGWEVYFGDVNNIEMKLSVYKVLVQRLKKEKIEPALISIEYVHAPYYRLER